MKDQQEKLDTIEALNRKERELDRQIDIKMGTINQVKLEIEAIEKQKALADSELKTLVKQKDEAFAVYEDIKLKSKSKESEKMELLHNLAKEYVIMEGQFKALKGEVDSVKGALASKLDEYSKAEASLVSLEKQIKSEKAKSEAEREKTIKAIDALKSEKDIIQGENKALVHENALIAGMNKAIIKENDSLGKSLEERKAQLVALESSMLTLSLTIKKNKEEIVELEQKKLDTETSISGSQEELVEIQKEVVAEKKKLSGIVDMKMNLERKESWIKAKYEEIGLQYE